MNVEPETVLTARAILLDMDGTLVDSDAPVERNWVRWAERYGFDGHAVYEQAHGRQAYATMAELLPDRPMEVNRAEGRALVEAETADLDGVVPIAGAPAFLAALARAPHALVTSADRPLARARMGAAGLPLPTVVVTSEDVTASKPAPEGYLKAAELLGVSPADCVVFEDSEAGIAAGRAAGMRVVGVTPRAARYAATAHVRDLNEVAVEIAADGTIRVVTGASSLLPLL